MVSKPKVIDRLEINPSNELMKGFWHLQILLIRYLLIFSFFFLLIFMFVYKPNDSFISGGIILKEDSSNFVGACRHEKSMEVLKLMYSDYQAFQELDSKHYMSFLTDSVKLKVGSYVEVLAYNEDSTVVKIRFVNGWAINDQKRVGFTLSRFVSLSK